MDKRLKKDYNNLDADNKIECLMYISAMAIIIFFIILAFI